jgi:hypothetical protein
VSIIALIARKFSVLGTRLGKRTVAWDDNKSLVKNGHCIPVYDTLRMAFAVRLHVPFDELNKDSSFKELGSDSVVAIQFPHISREHGY